MKLKVQLKLSISRLRMVQQKDTAKAKQQRREMAQLLEVCTAFSHACDRSVFPGTFQAALHAQRQVRNTQRQY